MMYMGPLGRIAMRAVGWLLVGLGLIDSQVGEWIANDPDLALLAGGTIAALAEVLYRVAKKRGWNL